MNHVLSTHLLVQHRLTTVWLDRIWDVGIPAVEFFCARQHLDYRNKEQVGELGHWFDDSSLKLHSIHSPMYSDDCWGMTGPHAVINVTEPSKPRRLEMVDEIKRALEIAEVIPFQYLIQHLGASGESWNERKLEAAFSSLEEICLFAKHRGVTVLLENIPNELSTPERLVEFREQTHLDVYYCLDTGHANLADGLDNAFALMGDRIRSTHVHDNNGKDDIHLFPLLAQGGTIDWSHAMTLLRSRAHQYPLLLELREAPDFPRSLETAREVFDKLESL